MAAAKSARKSKTTNMKHSNKQPQLFSNLLTFSAAFMGVIIGVAAALAVAIPMVHAEFADQSRQLSQRLVSMMPADDTVSSCIQPTATTTSTGGTGQVLGASTSTTTPTPTVTPPVKPLTPSTVFISKLVSGVFANTQATVSNTGPGSTNDIATTNTNTTTVTNDNNINVVSNSDQSSSSGSAATTDNTTGGSATSGNTQNNNSTSETISINN